MPQCLSLFRVNSDLLVTLVLLVLQVPVVKWVFQVSPAPLGLL